MVFPQTRSPRYSFVRMGAMLMFSLLSVLPVSATAETLDSDPQTYVYGDTEQASQVGNGYVVFQRRGQKVVGAFHYPRSEFSCFVGKMADQRLDVMQLGLGQDSEMPVEVQLSQLHVIETVGQSEQNSLSVCKQEVANLETQRRIGHQRHTITSQVIRVNN